MQLSRWTVLLTALALVYALAHPPRADALSTAEEIALWVSVGVVVFAGVVIVGTVLTREESKIFVIDPPPPVDDGARGVAFGLACDTPDGRPALVCW